VFSKKAIEERKRRDTQLTDEQIKRFMKSARGLRASDINRLHSVSRRHRRIYENTAPDDEWE